MGGVACPLNGTATATQIPIKIPVIAPGAYTFTVTTSGGSIASVDVFTAT
jgi:hypothetical protein